MAEETEMMVPLSDFVLHCACRQLRQWQLSSPEDILMSNVAGVLAMTRCAAGEYARQGVRVNSVVPGLMTPMRTSVVSADPIMRARFFERVPINREGTAQEAAKAVLFLSSDDASYLTGTDLVVDGGYTAYSY